MGHNSATGIASRHAAFLTVFALLGVLFFSAIREGNDWGGDFAIYVLEARNFAAHRPFAESSYVPTPESMRNHPAAYPPLTSLVLAPVYAVAGVDYRKFKVVLTSFLWLSLPLLYASGCRRGLPPAAVAVLLLLFGLSPLVFTLGSFVGSDALFLFVIAAALLAIDHIYTRQWDETRPITAAVLMVALLMLCCMTRAAGLALAGGFCANEIWRSRRLRPFGLASIGLLAVALFLYTRYVYQASGQYGSQFVLDPKQWLTNAASYLQTPAVLWTTAPRLVRYALSTSALLLLAIGFVRRVQQPTLIEFWIVLWLAILTAYSVNDKRYVLPVLPFLEMYALEALIFAMALLRSPQARQWVLPVCGTIAVAISAANLRALDTSPVREGVTQPSFAEVCSFLRGQTPADALILSWNPRVFALYTDKSSALYPQTTAPAEFEGKIPLPGPRFLVLRNNNEEDHRRLAPYVPHTAPHLLRVFENSDFQIYLVGGSEARNLQ